MFTDADKNKLIQRNKCNYEKYGYSPAALDWNKGKQDIRFSILTQQFDLKEKTILDIGCGFGDLLRYLNRVSSADVKRYIGIDLVEEFIFEARKRYASSGVQFFLGDFLDDAFQEKADFAIASGSFNYFFDNTDNYQFIENCMAKAFTLCREGIAFDFLSDKVDYRYNHAWYSNPGVILEMAYKFSRNIILRNDYMPFEFTVIIFKDDSFEKSDTLFNNYKKREKCNE